MTDGPPRRPTRIGLIGGGTIAAAILRDMLGNEMAEIAYVLVSDRGKDRGEAIPHDLLIDDREDALSRDVDLVVEAANPSVLADLAPRLLARSSVCGFSCTALAEPVTRKAIDEAVSRSGRRFYVPHGAVLGLDGLADGRPAIESVMVTTSKSGSSFGVDAQASGVIFEGSARDACGRFPRNVNVHAAIALAGIGFDRTQSRIVAVPGKTTMEHHISVTGQGLEWELKVSSRSLGGVTGSYTPLSAAGSVARIIAGGGVGIA